MPHRRPARSFPLLPNLQIQRIVMSVHDDDTLDATAAPLGGDPGPVGDGIPPALAIGSTAPVPSRPRSVPTRTTAALDARPSGDQQRRAR